MNFTDYDLGRLERGATVVVTLNGNAANVRLLTRAEFSNYKAGRRHRYAGGLVKRSPVRLGVGKADNYHLVVDMQGLGGSTRSNVRVDPPPLAEIQSARSPLSNIYHEPPPYVGSHVDAQVWDVFVSHASEDKDAVVRPLAEALRARGVTVWLDEAEMRIGDSLRRKIDYGLAHSTFGVVVFSRQFFSKGWTQYELDGLVTRAVSGEQSLLPVWHDITKDEVVKASPSLADKIARSTAQFTIDEIAAEIAEVVRP